MPRLLSLALLLSSAVSRAADVAPSAADSDFFERKVRPILVARCHECHSTSAKKQRGGLYLDNRDAILRGGDSGPAAVPGRPEASLLVKAIRYADSTLHMPPKSRLASGEVAILEDWVRRGLPYPNASAAIVKKQGINLAEGRKFWSFQPPRAVEPPPVKDSAWGRRRIDRFLLAAMEQRGLKPSPEAARRTLLRRLSFDLVGLPPTPEQIDQFLIDGAPDAYERLVDQLLASPRHGERWGRFWLDLVRYCDVAEQWCETKGPAWLYRDWVVRALNDDLPFDRFVEMQLAADFLPGASPGDHAALGFLGLSPTYWKELQLDPDVIKTVVAEEWEERIDAIGRTFLGLSLACARCHDHKFDPIAQHDYYALAGVLASTKQADRAVVPEAQAAPARQALQKIEQLNKEIEKLRTAKPAPADATKKIETLSSQIDQIRKATPFLDTWCAPGVEEASLDVLPDGPSRTKLVYRVGKPQDIAMQVRGNPANPGPIVQRRFVAVLCPDSPRPFTQGSGRLELARALTHEGAPLLSRVIVNRVWKHHFGTGLVDTPSDFGAQGSRPTHPELLDDLSARFIANGWSLKWLHREIVLSAAYRQASTTNHGQALDPDNRQHWRMNRRRLEIEAWRDAMLTATGSLRESIGGPPQDLADTGNSRRTLYGKVQRRELSDVLRLHDFPDPTTHSPMRLPTTTPLQQLFVLNGPFIRRQADLLVDRLRREAGDDDSARVRRAYSLLFGRPASDAQVRLASEFLSARRAAAEREESWRQYAQALLGSNECLFVD